MAHSVEHHLAVTPETYDVEILRFSPGYDAMLGEVTEALVRHRSADAPLEITDLGAGTGALSGRIAGRLTRAKLTLVDEDPAMLARAAERLAPCGDRIRLHHASFLAPLPACDAAVASLALHHVHDAGAKQDLYANIHRALAPEGVLLSADVFIPRAPGLAKSAWARWAAHLVDHGDTEAEAYARFEDWAKEDRYFAIEEEIDMLRAAGFSGVEVLWRFGPSGVLVAVR